jgi:phosphoglycerate kinase
MTIKSIKKRKNWQNKLVLLRLDLNVPVKNKIIQDDFKIKASLETINYLLKKKAKIIILSHLGRPEKVDDNYSLKIILRKFKQLLGEDISLFENISQIKKHKWTKEKIIILENLRFFKEEKKNSASFAQKLASLADIYVNDALAVSHRSHASVDKIKNYLPSYAGLLLEKELNNFSQVLKAKKPLILIMGGIKISTKIPLLLNLEKKADFILLGGGLANTFFYYQGLEIGQSVYEKNLKKDLNLLKNNKKIILPDDLLVKTRTNDLVLRKIDQVRKTDKIFDIGPKTIIKYCNLLKKAQTVIWNGPMGKFEEKSFSYGTLTLAISLASLKSSAFSLVGGGETIKALKLAKMENYVNWISTGGGAMLSYLGNEKMPGLSKLVK